MLAVRTMKRSVKIFLARRHKDELESVDDLDVGRHYNEEASKKILAWRQRTSAKTILAERRQDISFIKYFGEI
jgi:hypothetical protein